MTRSSRRGSGAFSLIETIIAIVVISIAAPPLLMAMAAAHDERAGPVMVAQARWIAIERLEEILRDAHSEARGYDYVIESNYADEAAVTDFPGFARSVSVTETDPDLVSSGTGVKTVVVSVTWTLRGSAPVTASVATVIAEFEP